MKPSRERVLLEGLWTGLLGYGTVALSVGLVDALLGRSFFHTAALLGGALFGGASGPGGEVLVTPDAVFAYNGVHLVAFLLIGLLVAWVVFQVELHPVFWYAGFFVLLGAFFLSFVVISAIGGGRGGEGVRWWSVLGPNVLAAAAMGAYLHRAHPRLWREVRVHPDPEAGDG